MVNTPKCRKCFPHYWRLWVHQNSLQYTTPGQRDYVHDWILVAKNLSADQMMYCGLSLQTRAWKTQTIKMQDIVICKGNE